MSPVGGQGCVAHGQENVPDSTSATNSMAKGSPQPDWGLGYWLAIAGQCLRCRPQFPWEKELLLLFLSANQQLAPGGPITRLCGSEVGKAPGIDVNPASDQACNRQAVAGCSQALVYEPSDTSRGQRLGYGLAFPPSPTFSCVVRARDDT